MQRQQQQQQILQAEQRQQQEFYGTWYSPATVFSLAGFSQTIVITNNEFRLDDSDGDYYYMIIDSWTVRSNPSGYIINGRVSGKKMYEMVLPIHLYLYNDGKNLR
jgi:hypothetical protein